MGGREFLAVARVLVGGGTEAHWRAAAGRAYYALLLECRDALRSWGFAPGPRDNVHPFVRLRLVYAADAGAKHVGLVLDRLCRLRNSADYDLGRLREFATDAEARAAIRRAEDALVRLDALQADAARRAAIVADIRAGWP